MDPSPLHPSLLRPPILHILRATGFTTTRPSVLDTLADLASRHLHLLCTTLSRQIQSRQLSTPDRLHPHEVTVTDVRRALQAIGTFYPAVSELEEQLRGEEDLRGMEAFLGWCIGESNGEVRRVAGIEAENSGLAITGTVDNPSSTLDTAKSTEPIGNKVVMESAPQDYLTRLKRKHAKTRDGEEARYAGTALGKDQEHNDVKIEGWESVGNLNEWGEMLKTRNEPKEMIEIMEEEVQVEEEKEEERGSEESSPLSEISKGGDGDVEMEV